MSNDSQQTNPAVLAKVFGKINKAKPISSFLPRLPVGNHRLGITRYAVKENQEKTGNILECDFVVLQSSTLKRGERFGWAWWPDAPGKYAGQYEEARAKEFLVVVGKSIGDDRTPEEIGIELAGIDQPGVGISVDVTVSNQVARNGTPKTNDKGEQYTSALWKAVSQDGDAINATRELIEKLGSGMKVEEPTETVTEAVTEPVKKSGLLGRLGK